jgi:hypothetical protein
LYRESNGEVDDDVNVDAKAFGETVDVVYTER